MPLVFVWRRDASDIVSLLSVGPFSLRFRVFSHNGARRFLDTFRISLIFWTGRGASDAVSLVPSRWCVFYDFSWPCAT